jgi:hypothetical protein
MPDRHGRRGLGVRRRRRDRLPRRALRGLLVDLLLDCDHRPRGQPDRDGAAADLRDRRQRGDLERRPA